MLKIKITNLLLITIFFILCAGSLFPTSSLFVNPQLAPKWYFTVFCTALIVLVYIISSSYSTQTITIMGIASTVSIIITSLCVLQALYGILQYAGTLPSNNAFRITGSFDNPAGFSASLCAGFPFLFYFVSREKTWKLYLAVIAGSIIIAAVILSASRAGIISIIAVCAMVCFYKIKMATHWKWLIVTVLLFVSLSGLYFLKKDSADGRLLIWRCSWEMIKDKTWFGHGYGGFKAHYMNYQAKYFEEHPDSKYTMLADNVNRPFNEYLLLLTDYGLAGLILFLACVWFLWKSFHRNRNKNIFVRIAGWCLLSIGVFSLFSYPLTYPFVWLIGIASIVIIIRLAAYPFKTHLVIGLALKLILIPAISISCVKIYQHIEKETLWCLIANKSLLGKTEEMIPVYEHLHKPLSNNELFLYNYAAELNVIENHDRSLHISRECESLWADYDLQMLMADNCRQLEHYLEAEEHYILASQMCPVRFMPLYKLFQLYEATDENEKAKQIAKAILNKPVKVMSSTIRNIKEEVKQKKSR